jgi:hypothetical protein
MTTMTRDFTDEIAVREEQAGYAGVNRNEAITAIRAALKRRTGRTWSVTGGRGTGYGWIHVQSPPKRRTGVRVKNPDYDPALGYIARNPEWILVDSGEPQEFGYMTPEDIEILAKALGLTHVHEQGWTIPASSDYRVEAIARAEGRAPSVYGEPYWD